MHIEAWLEPDPENPRLRPSQKLEDVNKIVIRDHLGQPAAIFIQASPDHLWIIKAGDDEFGKALKFLGVKDKQPKVVNANA